jgi:hypothetical protein
MIGSGTSHPSAPISDHADVNGFIDSMGDVDWYSFRVEKGRLYRVRTGYYRDGDWIAWQFLSWKRWRYRNSE